MMAVECLDTYEVFITERYQEDHDLQAIVDLLEDDYGVQTCINDVHYHLQQWRVIPIFSAVHLIDDWHDWHPRSPSEAARPASYHRCRHCISQVNIMQDPAGENVPLTRYRKTMERHEKLAYGFYHYEEDADLLELSDMPDILLAGWLPLSHRLERLFPSDHAKTRILKYKRERQRSSKQARPRTSPKRHSGVSDTEAVTTPSPTCSFSLSISTEMKPLSEGSLPSPASVSMIVTDEAGSPQLETFPPSPFIAAFSGLENSSLSSAKRASSEMSSSNKRRRLEESDVELDRDDELSS